MHKSDLKEREATTWNRPSTCSSANIVQYWPKITLNEIKDIITTGYRDSETVWLPMHIPFSSAQFLRQYNTMLLLCGQRNMLKPWLYLEL